MKFKIKLFPAAVLLSIAIHGAVVVLDLLHNSSFNMGNNAAFTEKMIKGVSILPQKQAAAERSKAEINPGEAAEIENQKNDEASFIVSENTSEINEPVKEQNSVSRENVGSNGTGLPSQEEAYLRYNFSAIQLSVTGSLVYPARAQKAGMQGIVEILFTIDTDGNVREALVQTTSGYEVLDNAARQAVYKAAPFPKPPERMKIAMPIKFELKK